MCLYPQVIALWLQDISLEESNTCGTEAVTLQDEIGIIGENPMKS